MIRIRIPAIREIKGDNEMPATIKVDNVDNGKSIGQSPGYCVNGRFRPLIVVSFPDPLYHK